MPAVAWCIAASPTRSDDLIYAVIEDFVFIVSPDRDDPYYVFRIKPVGGANEWAVQRVALTEAGGGVLRGRPVVFDPSVQSFDEIAHMSDEQWNFAPTFFRELVGAISSQGSRLWEGSRL